LGLLCIFGHAQLFNGDLHCARRKFDFMQYFCMQQLRLQLCPIRVLLLGRLPGLLLPRMCRGVLHYSQCSFHTHPDNGTNACPNPICWNACPDCCSVFWIQCIFMPSACRLFLLRRRPLESELCLRLGDDVWPWCLCTSRKHPLWMQRSELLPCGHHMLWIDVLRRHILLRRRCEFVLLL